MTNNPTVMLVVAGHLRDEEGRFLLQKRPPGKRHAGLWEFPGGKVETGEMPRLALVRELAEELGIAVGLPDVGPIAFAEHDADADGPAIVILLYNIERWTGDPLSLEGGEIGWFSQSEVLGLPKPKLDRDLLEALIRPCSQASRA